MKKTSKALAVLMAALMMLVSIPVVSSVAAETVNLIQNGDFETGDTSGWQTYQSTAVSAAAAKEGQYGINAKGDGGWGGMLCQTISGLEVGKIYRFSFVYKANSAGVNVSLSAGTTDKGTRYGYCYASKTAWTDFAVEFEAVEAVAFLNVCGSGAGIAEDVYIDNIMVAEVVLGGNDEDQNLKMIDTVMDNIKTQGRTAMVGGTLMLDFSISGIEFALDCSGDVYATFNARSLSSTSSTGGVYFTIVVDGERLARDYCHIKSVGETKVLLAENLPAGKHTFAIYRQSEHQYGEVGVCALSYGGTILDKPADKPLSIEFIGDSISCGFGILGNSSVGDGSALYSDGSQAYTFLTAQQLNADWSNVSWSGLGCKYGYSSITMQDVYPAQRYNYDKTKAYDFSNEPDVIILSLGTNDNSKAPDAASKRAGMVEMLTLVREKNPNAPIVWIYNMMTSGVNAMVEEIVEEFGGEEAGYYACKLTMNTSGGGWHPNLAGQQRFADELVDYLVEKDIVEIDYSNSDLLSMAGTARMEMNDNRLGLGFGFKLDAAGVVAKENYSFDLTNATVDVLGNGYGYKLVGMGALLSNDALVGTDADKMTLDHLSSTTVDVPAKYLWEVTDTQVSYAVRVTNIPKNCALKTVYARPYYIFEFGGEQIVVYGDIVSARYEESSNFNDGTLVW